MNFLRIDYVAAGKVDPTTAEATELLVDGQQRMTTLYQYFKGDPDLKLPSNIVPYADLTEEDKLEFLEYEVVIRDLGNKPIETIKQIFQRINSTSYGLNAMEIHNARYAGKFKQFGEDIAQLPFFEKYRFFSSADIRRMNDTLYCLGLVVTIMSTYFNRFNEIEEYLNRYDEEFDAESDVRREMEIVLDRIDSLEFDSNSRVFKKADFFSLFVEFHKVEFKEGKKVDIKKTRKSIDSFFKKVEQAAAGDKEEDSNPAQYYKAALQASNDRKNRIRRGEILREMIVRN